MRLVPSLSQASCSGKTVAGSGRSMAILADEKAMVPDLDRRGGAAGAIGAPALRGRARLRQDIVGSGFRIANIAPCGSTNIARRPTSGMSVGGTITFAPSDFGLLGRGVAIGDADVRRPHVGIDACIDL